MDCTVLLNKQIYDDSKIAGKTTCARTKCEAIINGIIGPHSINVIIKSMDEIQFLGVATDGSNHGAIKLFPIVIQYYDWKQGGSGVQVKLLELRNTPNETSETISAYIKSTLEKYKFSSKCIAFSGDNTNTNFGGINRKTGKNIFSNLKVSLERNIVAIGCPAHILHNCVQHGTDGLNFDIESIVLKIFNFFSIYTVRTEALKDFCDFVDVNYRDLLYHSKTRWLSLFPAINRILQMYPALKAYFLSQDQPPKIILNFFENEFSEIYLFFLHSLMSIFQSKIQLIERQDNYLLEITEILNSTKICLTERLNQQFLPLKVRELLSKLEHDGNGNTHKCAQFKEESIAVYARCLDYLSKWSQAFEEFSCFEWMRLKVSQLEYGNLTDSIYFLRERGVDIDDVVLFDQFCNLKIFVKSQEESFHVLNTGEKWTFFFSKFKQIKQCMLQ